MEEKHSHTLCLHGWPEEQDCWAVAESCSCITGKPSVAGLCIKHGPLSLRNQAELNQVYAYWAQNLARFGTILDILKRFEREQGHKRIEMEIDMRAKGG